MSAAAQASANRRRRRRTMLELLKGQRSGNLWERSQNTGRPRRPLPPEVGWLRRVASGVGLDRWLDVGRSEVRAQAVHARTQPAGERGDGGLALDLDDQRGLDGMEVRAGVAEDVAGQPA